MLLAANVQPETVNLTENKTDLTQCMKVADVWCCEMLNLVRNPQREERRRNQPKI